MDESLLRPVEAVPARDATGSRSGYWQTLVVRTTGPDAGVDPKIVADRIGHANMAYTLAIYTHKSTGRDRGAAETGAGYSWGPGGRARSARPPTSAWRRMTGCVKRAARPEMRAMRSLPHSG